MRYTQEQLDLIARHVNGFVQQDDDGNVVWNTSPDAESGWRPIYAEACQAAIAAES